MESNLDRFIGPQMTAWPEALVELAAGRKRGHWMWFIFPQLRGLGQSSVSWYYGIENRAEARAYLAHPTLGSRLRCAVRILLEGKESDPDEIFGDLDARKLRSCLTLFAAVEGPESVFARALDRFFAGTPDKLTLELLEKA